MIYSYDNHTQEFLNALDSDGIIEIDETMFYYFLGVLPPVFMSKTVTDYPGMEGEKTLVSFGFAEGAERILYFTQTPENKFFCVRSKRVNPMGY